MQTEGSVSVRSALLQAVLATGSGATLARLLAAGTCAALLATWLNVNLSSRAFLCSLTRFVWP